MKRKVVIIFTILLLGLVLAGSSLALARAQHYQVQPSNPVSSLPPAMNWERVTEYGFVYSETHIGAVTALEVFSGSLYAGTTAATTGTVIYRSEDGTNWVSVNEPGFGLPIPTSDPPCNAYWYYMWDTVVFSDDLYIPVGVMCQDPAWYYYGGQIWRTEDGLTWAAVVADSFGYTNTQGVNILTEFDGMLYAGTVDLTRGLQIWRSATGNAGDWEDVTPSNLVMPAQYYANDFQVYHDMLFLATGVYTVSGESQLWFTEDGITWEEGPIEMFTCEPDCTIGNLEVFSETLYMGTYNFISGGELWQTTDGITWTLSASSGDPNVWELDPSGVFQGYMYVTQRVSDDSGFGIGSLYRTTDGVNFELASRPGFDLRYGGAIFPNGSAIFNDRLYLGKFNWDVGGSIWRNAPLDFWLPIIQR